VLHLTGACLQCVDALEAATVSPRALAKQLQLGNTATLERRIRRELEDIGTNSRQLVNSCGGLMRYRNNVGVVVREHDVYSVSCKDYAT